MAVYVCGDTHGTHDLAKLKAFRNVHPELTKNDYVIVCGDFGLLWNNEYFVKNWETNKLKIPNQPHDEWWDDNEVYLYYWYESCPWTTLFVDGNHENFDRLNSYPITEWNGGRVQKISDSIIHLMRGEIYEIDGHSYFCMGGAMSTDRGPAVGNEDIAAHNWWWPQEIPTIDDWNNAYNNLEKYQWTVDFIITHDTPASVTMAINKGYRISEVSNRLEMIKYSTDFIHWFCGHMHCDKDFEKVSILYRDLPINVEEYNYKF